MTLRSETEDIKMIVKEIPTNKMMLIFEKMEMEMVSLLLREVVPASVVLIVEIANNVILESLFQ